MSDENKVPEGSSAAPTTPEEVQAHGTPITVGGDGGPAPAAASGTPITVGGDGSPQQQ